MLRFFSDFFQLAEFDDDFKHFYGERVEWFRPTDIQSLLQLKKKHAGAKLVCGNTEVGIEMKFKGQLYSIIISPTHVPELNAIEVVDDGIWFGGSVTLSRLDETLQAQIDCLPESKTRIYCEIVEMLHWFAGHQIRNVSVRYVTAILYTKGW